MSKHTSFSSTDLNLSTYNDIFKRNKSDHKDDIKELSVDSITPFKNHPFKVVDDESMKELVESIKQHGVLVPVSVRPLSDDKYEMISGHRRLHASIAAGLTTIPAVVKQMNDDEAVIAMVDSNMQREKILPSERAFALKMKHDALKNQGSRTDLKVTSGTGCQKLDSAEAAGADDGLKTRQVRMYIRLTELIPELLDMVDKKQIAIKLAVEISYFNKDIQEWIYEYSENNSCVNKNQIALLKSEDSNEELSKKKVFDILDSVYRDRRESNTLKFSRKTLSKYFPDSYSVDEQKKIILKLLEEWKDKNKD